MEHLHNGTLHSRQEKSRHEIFLYMDRYKEYYAEWNKLRKSDRIISLIYGMKKDKR